MPQSIETKEYSYLNNIDKDTLDAMLMVANTLDENTLDALLDLIAGGGASGGGGLFIVDTFTETEDSYVDTINVSYNDLLDCIENGTVLLFKDATDDGHGEVRTEVGVFSTWAISASADFEDPTKITYAFTVDNGTSYTATDPDALLSIVEPKENNG